MLPVKLCKCPENKQSMVTFTFDDGLKDHLSLAAPELEKRGWHGTFFITSRCNDRPPFCWLDHKSIRELSDRGHEIGAHTVTHQHLNPIAEQGKFREIAWELNANVEMLEQLTEKKIRSYTAPFGERPDFMKKLLASKNIFDTDNRIRIGRNINGIEDLEALRERLLTEGAWSIIMFHGVKKGVGGWDEPITEGWFEMVMDFFNSMRDQIWFTTAGAGADYIKARNSAEWEQVDDGAWLFKTDPAVAGTKVYFQLENPVTTRIMINDRPWITETNGVFCISSGDIVSMD